MSMAAAAPGGSDDGNGGGDKKWKVPESRPNLFKEKMEEDDDEEKKLPNPTKKEMEQKGRGKWWLRVKKSGGKSFIMKRKPNPQELILDRNIRNDELPPPPPSDDDDDDSKGSDSKKPNK